MKHDVKKILVCILCLCMAAMLLTACSGDDGAPAGFTGIANENNDYVLYVPQNWTTDETKGMTAAMYPDGSGAYVSVTPISVGENVPSAAEYWASYRDQFEKTLSDFQLINDGKAGKLGDTDAIEYVYSGSVTGAAYQYRQLLATRNNVIYIFTYSALTDQYEEHMEEVNAIIENFRFN